MFKKVTIPLTLILILVLGLVFSSTALAAPEGPDSERNQPRGGIGTVVSASDGQLVVDRRSGGRLHLAVEEQTVLRDLDGSLLALEDLQTGDTVLVAGVKADGGRLVARLVVKVPADFEPGEARLGRRAHGEVTAVDESANTLSLRTPAGELLTFQMDSGTRYLGSLESLADVETGARVFVIGMILPDERLLALAVGGREALQRDAGKILDVSPSTSSFTLQTRTGETLAFQVDENTRFKSRDGQIHTLANLKPEMLALVRSKPQDDGALLAVMVAAGEKPVLPEFEVKLAGQVTQVNTDSFTLKTRDGEEYTFQVSEETRFFSRSRQVKGLEQLQVGMRIGVGAQDMGGGSYLALAVMAGRPPQP